MDKRIIKKVKDHSIQFKEDIRKKVLSEFSSKLDEGDINQLMKYIYDYEGVSLDKEDFSKRKRVKNVVHLSDRCVAKRANNEQCTRRRKKDCEYCGTHMKGTPHGICEISNEQLMPSTYQKQVWVQDIKGILYYIDSNNNVYQTEDVISNKVDPKIIAKYVKYGDVYSIPEFGI